MTQKLDVEGTVTTVSVGNQTFEVYEYHNGRFIDIIVRDSSGHRIDQQHPKFNAIGNAYTDSTPED